MRSTISWIIPRYVLATVLGVLLMGQPTLGQPEQKTEGGESAADKKADEKKPGDIQDYDEVITAEAKPSPDFSMFTD